MSPGPTTRPALRCTWHLDVCGGGIVCLLSDGHSDSGWHKTWGETWFHAWREDDEDAYCV